MIPNGTHRPGMRPGFALAVAMVAIVVIGALIAGAFWTSNQDFRSARNGLAQERALAAAEYGQNYVLGNWVTSWASNYSSGVPIGDTLAWTLTPDSKSTARVRMTRLNENTFWVVSEGITDGDAGAQARHRTNQILRINSPDIHIAGAISSAGIDTVTGNTTVSGNDNTPTNWSECPPAGPAKSAIANDNTSDVYTAGGCAGGACLSGTTPLIKADASLASTSTTLNYGGLNFDSLTARADLTHTYTATGLYTGLATDVPAPILSLLQPSVSGSPPSCNVGATASMGGTTLGSNWGENNHAATSTAACIPYYPVVWLKGGTGVLMRITQLRGQGIMLIDTNVQIQGGFNFTGLILVRQGRLQISGTSTNPTKITGAIMSASTTPNKASVALSGTADVAYSSCAIAQALAQTLSRPVPAPGRAWAEMF